MTLQERHIEANEIENLVSNAFPDDKHKKRPNAFGGRSDLADTYRQAKTLAIKHKIFRVSQFVEFEGTKQLTICNLWRIERYPDDSFKTFEYLLNEEKWVEVTVLDFWPELPFYPIAKTTSLEWWRQIIRGALWKALIAAGYYDLPKYLNVIEKWTYDENGKAQPVEGKKEMTRHTMAYQLIRKYVGRQDAYDKKKNEYAWIDGFLKPDVMQAGARALRAVFCDHFLDGKLLSAILAIDYQYLTFVDYLRYALHRNGLLKVSSEHRNLLPMLPHINPIFWDRPDLFSRKLWVRGDRKSTVVDRAPFNKTREFRKNTKRRFSSFDSAVCYRWLTKASSVLIKEWSNSKDMNWVSNIAVASIDIQAPVIAYKHTLRSKTMPVTPFTQRVYRLFLLHCAEIWKTKGFSEIKLWLRGPDANIGNMLDYLMAEGFQQGLPNKHSTWTSLVRRSNDWHRRIAIENMEREKFGSEQLEWQSLIEEIVIDDVHFKALTTSRAVALEGYELRHCVGQYRYDCMKGIYRVFSSTESDGTRSTLGFAIQKRATVLWDQHISKFNGAASPIAIEAGKKLAALYQAALDASNEEKK